MTKRFGILLIAALLTVGAGGFTGKLLLGDNKSKTVLSEGQSSLEDEKAPSEGNAGLEENSNNDDTKNIIDNIDLDDKYLVLVNKENRLEKSFVPEDLVLPKVAFVSTADPLDRVMEGKAARALEDMFSAAKKEGINLLGRSGYRSYSIQDTLYNSNVRKNGRNYADKYSAQPGASEHQTGLAMDIVSDEHLQLTTSFEDTEAFRWLSENAYKYGFILRYMKGKEGITGYNYEPWHYRYVGQPYSEYITKNKLTFEEFVEEASK